ncbi:hypothetical protein [Hoeflea sp.]|uniref:hypothetical protein n=1 Tax=Hoeflea sp. TaxID=1940281 RepID=UPI003B011D91
MKPVSYFAALLAGVAILVPMGSIDAQAVDIKVQRAVKVHPKAVAKPRIKVSPKVAVKPKVKVKTPKVAVNPKIKIAPKAVKPKIKVNVAARPKNDSARDAALPPDTAVPAPSAKPTASQREINIAKVPVPKPREPQPGIQDAFEAKEAANAAEAARELAGMKDIRAGATAEFGFNMPELGGEEAPGKQDQLGGVPGRKGSGFGFGDDLGSGPFLPGPQNSHGGKTPNNPYAVTPESIAAGMGGVAGQQTERLPLHKEVDHSRDQPSFASNGQVGTSDYLKQHPDGTSTLIHEEYNVLADTHTDRVIQYDRDGNIVEDTGPRPIEGDSAGQSATELRNPDHVGGNPDCWGIDCVVGSSEPKGLITKKTDNNQVLTAAPDHANPNGTGGSPVVSQEQLLSRYDTERSGGSSPTPIDTRGACQDC